MTTKESGIYPDIQQRLKEINGTRIDIGYFEGDNYTYRLVNGVKIPLDSPLPIALVAFWNDKGTRNIHERPFLSTLFPENGSNYRKLSREYAYDVLLQKRTTDQMMNRLGSIMVSDVKLKITNIRAPANALSTVRAKGFDNPLIWTGRMRANTKYKVHK